MKRKIYEQLKIWKEKLANEFQFIRYAKIVFVSAKTRKRLRRTHFKLEVTGLVTCPNCGAMIKAHHVCPKCGHYAGKAVYLNGKVVK